MSFIRSSKYRHVFGKGSKRDESFDNIKVSRSAWDTNLVSASARFVAINIETGGGGAFAVLPITRTGKQPEALPVFNGHGAAVLDTAFSPFNDLLVASASEDCKAMLWAVPTDGLTESCAAPLLTLSGHGRKVGHVVFNPVAENILATTSADMTVKIWDLEKGTERIELKGHEDLVLSATWNYCGDSMVTTCKDKKVRVFDVRSGKVAQEAAGHVGIKGSRVASMGNSPYFITTGFGKTSDRQVYVWDTKNLSAPLKELNGDGNIRYYEWIDDDKSLYYLSEYKSADPLRGICFLPKRACAINETEVARAFKVHTTMVEPIPFKVPRKSDQFQSDLFPPTIGGEAAMSATEWFDGKTLPPLLINLENGFSPAPFKEFTISRAASIAGAALPRNSSSAPTIESLSKEVEILKIQLAAKDARIKQLEMIRE